CPRARADSAAVWRGRAVRISDRRRRGAAARRLRRESDRCREPPCERRYWVRSSAARRGVAAAAVRELIDWAKANTDLHRLEILMAVGNAASIHVAEKIGGVREGVLRSRLLLHGEFHQAVLFSVIL